MGADMHEQDEQINTQEPLPVQLDSVSTANLAFVYEVDVKTNDR